MAGRRSGLAVALVLGLLAACSSSGDDASPDTTTVTPPAPSITDTLAPTTTTATTSAPTTTEATPTTIDPAQALAAEVEADYREAIRLAEEASKYPFDAEAEAAALERRLGVIRDNFAARLATYRQDNLAIRENDGIPATITVEVPARLVAPSDDVIEMQVCEVDSWIVVEVGAGPNGTDAIVNPDVAAYRAQVFMRNVDGVWKYEGGNDLETWEGATSCPGG